MKKAISALAALALAAAAARADGKGDANILRQTVDATFRDVQAAFAAAPVPADKTVAVLPVAGDKGLLFAGRLKNAITAAGRKCIEDKDDPAFGEILKEIAWDERKEDVLDGATVQKFGRLLAAQVLVTASVRAMESNERYAYFEIELHATEIATKRHLWGSVFAKHVYAPEFKDAGRAEGIPAPLRDAIAKDMRAKIEASLKGAPKLASVKKAAILPLPGDVKGYVLSVVRDAFSGTSISPANLDVATLGEARIRLRDSPGDADAVLYGSVRDLSERAMPVSPSGGTNFQYRAEVQLRLERPDGTVLWSDTVQVSAEHAEKPGMWGALCAWFPVLKEKPWLAVAVPAGVVVALAVLAMFLRAVTRPR